MMRTDLLLAIGAIGLGSVSALLGGCGTPCGSTNGVADFSWTGAGGQSLSSSPQSKVPIYSGSSSAFGTSVNVRSRCVEQQALAITAALRDPVDASVPVANMTRIEVDSSSYTAVSTLSFTPPRPGNYRMHVALEPGLKQSDRAFTVFQSAPMPRPVLQTFNKACTVVQATASQTWLCDGDVIRGTQTVQTLAGTTAVAGNTVWQINAGNLSRYVDSGSGALIADPVVPLGVSSDAVIDMMPTESDVVVLTAKELTRYVRTGATLVKAGSVGVRAESRGFRAGEQIFVITSPIVPLREGTTVCAVQVQEPDTLVPAQAPCQKFPESLIGLDEQAIWLGEYGSLTVTESPYVGYSGYVSLKQLIPAGAQVMEAGTVRLPSTYEASPAQRGGTWIISKDVKLQLVPRYADGVLFLEEFSTVFPLTGSSSRFFLSRHPTLEQTTVFSL